MARYEWTHLRIQDFKTVVEYNYAMFRITSQLKLCGETITKEDKLEKTFNTFHASNVLLQQQSEQNNELLMKNYQSLPTRLAPFPEVNDASLEGNTTSSHGMSFKNANHQKGKTHMNTPRNPKGVCHRCGGNGHWARTCRTLKHLVDLYQASLKEKGVETNFLDQADISDLMFDLSGQLNTTHLDVSDFIIERGNEVFKSD
ncbi:uncharacterized protein LOC126630176 [Malus sylvestris]|uniref:uncharacterized protein LOC126630176 n=1 Tax=Malus sylvestris TaxID=3752 RepID=UPI0021AC7D2A|nr:uncharacterized protein LOC126630176 [Malus sylvestris]